MHLNRAAAAPLARLDAFSISRLAQRIDDVATALLRDLNPDDPRHGLYCCVMFVMKLVDEGRFPDVRNQAVLFSMLLLEDVRDERKDVDGQGVVWRLEEKKWQDEAARMLNRAITMGLYARSGAASCNNPLNLLLSSCYPLDGGKRRQNGHSLTAANWELPPEGWTLDESRLTKGRSGSNPFGAAPDNWALGGLLERVMPRSQCWAAARR